METATSDALSTPLGSVERGQLVFTRGASHLTIRVDGSMEDLYRARFDGKVPEIEVDGGTVSVRYRPSFHPPKGVITLSGRIPWAIHARWGMSDVEADLEGVELIGIEISGGTSRLELRLPSPRTTVPVSIGGGASDVEVVRPEGVPTRVRIGGGASKLTIDDLSVGSAGGKTDRQSPDYDGAEARYDLRIGAGASRLTVRT